MNVTQKLINKVTDMSDDNMDELKEIAKEFDIRFSGNTGFKTLKEKVLSHFEEVGITESDNTDSEVEPSTEVEKPQSKKDDSEDIMKVNPNTIKNPAKRREAIRAQALRLVRVKVINLDPNDTDLGGDYYHVSNDMVDITRFVQWGDEYATHIEHMLYEALKAKTFVQKKKIIKPNMVTGINSYKLVKLPKFSIEVLPPLTKEELAELAKSQKASNSIE